jgi:hypothetical protein
LQSGKCDRPVFDSVKRFQKIAEYRSLTMSQPPNSPTKANIQLVLHVGHALRLTLKAGRGIRRVPGSSVTALNQ